MLSLSNVSDGASAAVYYEQSDDYYSADHSPSQWWGLGAESLGLSGCVDPVAFASLLDGKLPTGERLHHAAAGRRGGTDATFSAPKSVSLQALVGGDARLLDAHQRAVDRALAHAETLAACRVTEDGDTRTVRTGNLVVARFEHDLSRACDPQLHTHCVMINATRRKDGQWRAMDNEPMYRHKMLLGALYRSELAREVQALGYGVRLSHLDGRFELSHINDQQVRAFSQRSAAIEVYLKEQRGLERSEASAWDKKLIAVITRDKKTAVDRDVLRQEWETQSVKNHVQYNPPTLSHHAVKAEAVHGVVADAVAHLGEREAVFGHAALLRTALERAVGTATLDELQAALAESLQRGELIRNGGRYTTPAAQQRERELLDAEAQGRDTLAPVYTGERDALQTRLQALSKDQQSAALAVLLTCNQVIGIQGRAGVGKTTLLSATTKIAVESGYTVTGLAPSAAAARELDSAGIAAETIASFTQRSSKGLHTKTILVVDEAGMTSTRQLHTILTEAAAAGCRVVLVGDTAQLAAVEAGKPFAQLQAHGMATAVVGQIQRQKNPQLKHAVELAVDGQVAMAVQLLEKQVIQIPATSQRFDQIARDYAALSADEREQALVIAGTRHARAAINHNIRTQLGLGADGINLVLLSRKDHTEAQRRSILSYDAGDVVQAEKHYPSLGLQRGDMARVVARLDRGILLERQDGVRVAWQPAIATRLSAFVPALCSIAVGELLRFTANDRARGFINGDTAKVVKLDAERHTMTLALADGRQVDMDTRQPLVLDYGYCSTVYGAQGQTCDRVLIEADAHSLTASQNTFYVAISRARHAAHIYTDDREMLPLAMSRKYVKESALELVPHDEMAR